MEKDLDLKDYKEFIKSTLQSWAALADEEILFSKFHSYSNTVFKVTTEKDVKPNTLVFRVFQPLFFGQPKEAFGYISQVKELKIFEELSKSGYGPKCYAQNEKYRIEEFLNSDQIPHDAINNSNLRISFVRWIANFNKIETTGFEKEVLAYHKYYNTINLKEVNDALDAKLTSKELEDQIKELKNMYSQVTLDFLIKSHPKDSVLCHGDLNYANILQDKASGEVKLIDYERACLSITGDEIACFIFYGLIQAYQGDLKLYPENYPKEEIFHELAEQYIVFSDLEKDKSYEVSAQLIKEDAYKDHLTKNYKSDDLDKRVVDIIRNIKIALMNFCYVNCFGCLKFNFIPDPVKNLEYLTACCQYFKKLRAELDK